MLYFQNILNINDFGDILLFPSNFLSSSGISFIFLSKFISFKFPSSCKNFLSKGNFLQSGSAVPDPPFPSQGIAGSENEIETNNVVVQSVVRKNITNSIYLATFLGFVNIQALIIRKLIHI